MPYFLYNLYISIYKQRIAPIILVLKSTTSAKMKKWNHTQNVCIKLMLFNEKNANNKVEEYNKENL